MEGKEVWFVLVTAFVMFIAPTSIHQSRNREAVRNRTYTFQSRLLKRGATMAILWTLAWVTFFLLTPDYHWLKE